MIDLEWVIGGARVVVNEMKFVLEAPSVVLNRLILTRRRARHRPSPCVGSRVEATPVTPHRARGLGTPRRPSRAGDTSSFSVGWTSRVETLEARSMMSSCSTSRTTRGFDRRYPGRRDRVDGRFTARARRRRRRFSCRVDEMGEGNSATRGRWTSTRGRGENFQTRRRRRGISRR